jgi:hypothetical protein
MSFVYNHGACEKEALMPVALQIQTTILPGNRIEIQAAELPEGKQATVLVLVDDTAPPKRKLSDILAAYPGGQLFRSAEEVDAFLKEERESWDS